MDNNSCLYQTLGHSYVRCSDLRDDITFQDLHLRTQILLDVSIHIIKHALKQFLQNVVLVGFSLI